MPWEIQSFIDFKLLRQCYGQLGLLLSYFSEVLSTIFTRTESQSHWLQFPSLLQPCSTRVESLHSLTHTSVVHAWRVNRWSHSFLCPGVCKTCWQCWKYFNQIQWYVGQLMMCWGWSLLVTTIQRAVSESFPLFLLFFYLLSSLCKQMVWVSQAFLV